MSVTDDGLNDIYEALDRYNWDDDIEFQAGLQAIIGSNSTPEQTTELALRARCFYYARYDRDSRQIHATRGTFTNTSQKVQQKHRLQRLQSLPQRPQPPPTHTTNPAQRPRLLRRRRDAPSGHHTQRIHNKPAHNQRPPSKQLARRHHAPTHNHSRTTSTLPHLIRPHRRAHHKRKARAGHQRDSADGTRRSGHGS